jgi:hypothetical protein
MWALLEACRGVPVFWCLKSRYNFIHFFTAVSANTSKLYRYITFIPVVVFSVSALVHPTRAGIHIILWLEKILVFSEILT